jgi:septal ring factor EnvC (AmiA/AmiB activator)
MEAEEELEQLRAEKKVWREIAHEKHQEVQQLQQERQTLRDALTEAIQAIGHWQEHAQELAGRIEVLQERLKTLEGQQAKDSHNSSLPPSSDRFARPAKSLRQKSGKKPGGQPGHQGHHLTQADLPDTVVIYPVELCERCQQDLRGHAAEIAERRQVMDLPTKRLWVTEQKAGREAVSRLSAPNARQLSYFCQSSCSIWDRHRRAGGVSGGRPNRSLRTCEPIAPGFAGGPALRRQYRQLCQNRV